MSATASFWGEEKKRSIEEQIDPSFSRQQLQQNEIQHLNQLAAAQQQQQSQQQAQQSLAEENFDVAAAAVAVSDSNVAGTNNKADQSSSSQQSQDPPLSRNGRPLTNTKRAAQNRSAQRAFRLRKEQYIKQMEEKVAEVDALKQTIETLKHENMQLRDYSLALQAKLIEQPDIPPPPVVFRASKKD